MTRLHQDVRLVEQMETLFHAGSLGGLSDGALLDRFQARDVAGSEAAFAELVKRHGPMVLGACRRILADPHLAEDALQAAFLVLARRAGSVRNRETLGGWLHRVACRIAWRSRKRADRRRAKEEPMVEDIASKADDCAEDVELRSILDQEVDRLRDVQRLPVVLCCLQGLSHEEASQRLCWPLGTVKSRLARGREKLQARLIRRGVAPVLAATALTGGMQAAETAALSSALVKSTAALAWKTSFAGAGASATVAALVGEELGSVLAIKLKIGAAVMMGGLAIASVGLLTPASSGPKPRGEDSPKPALIQNEARNPAPPPIVAKLSASGQVVDAAGKPVAGAKVYLREWTLFRVCGMAESESRKLFRGETLNDVLADRSTDAEGRFEFKDVPAPGFLNTAEVGKTDFPWDIVAVAPGRGLAWIQLDRSNQLKPITLTLGEEGIVRGKLVEPEGKPVAGAKVTVFEIDEMDRPSRHGFETENRLNLIWSDFLVMKTDADGRFTIHGLPRDKVATIVVTEPRHERLLVYAASGPPSGVAPPSAPGPSEPTAVPKILRGDFTLTTRVADHVLSGRVVFEADGKPAPKASFIHGWEIEKLDAEGRFLLEGLVPGKADLHAYDDASDAAPGEVEISIPETPKETEYTLVLPRGLVLRGRVVDGASGRGVGDVKVRYTAEPKSGTRFGLEDETDSNGAYRIVVPPGRGVVEVTAVPEGFQQPAGRYTEEPPNASFSKPVDGQAGQTIELLDIPLRRAGESAIRVVGQDGRPVFHAEVRLLDPDPRPAPRPGRTDAEGRYRVVGRKAGQGATVDVLSPDQSEGGSVEVPDADSPGKKAGEFEVRLRPVGSLSGRVLDEKGEPLPGAVLILYRNVRYADRAGMSFGKPVETGIQVANNGAFSCKKLIPDATYSMHVEVGGRATATSQHVKIKPGEETRLKDFRLPATDQELTGLIVDLQGKPVAGASINLQFDGRDQALYAPKGAVWFQNTDTTGRFHLTGLPRGAKRLMAYRNEGTERNIRNLKYADVAEGQKEVRIELPDINERLRGIE